jgi:predicted metalloprotease
MTYAAAEADAANKRIRIRQTAYDRLRQNCPWALETLVHELSHFHLEHTGIHHRRAGEIIRAGTPMTRRTLTF